MYLLDTMVCCVLSLPLPLHLSNFRILALFGLLVPLAFYHRLLPLLDCMNTKCSVLSQVMYYYAYMFSPLDTSLFFPGVNKAIIKTKNFFKKKKNNTNFLELKRWLSRQEHLLLLQRAQILFLGPTWWFMTICNSSLADQMLKLSQFGK